MSQNENNQPDVQRVLAKMIDDPKVSLVASIQHLWRGYGEIARYWSPRRQQHVVVKHVVPPVLHNAPLHEYISHQRKLTSFQVEADFYRTLSYRTGDSARLATVLGVERTFTEHQNADPDIRGWIIAMEDLDASGFYKRGKTNDINQVNICLRWLAAFHAEFLAADSDVVWATGSYWHLKTREVEWNAMPDNDLKIAAKDIADRLARARFKTIIHGDAKLANFCFADNDETVAAVDFQYTGYGVGITDVMLLMSSALSDELLHTHAADLLDKYFMHFRSILNQKIASEKTASTFSVDAIEAEWRERVSDAWADYHRFLSGWKAGHPRINSFMQQQTNIALAMSTNRR